MSDTILSNSLNGQFEYKFREKFTSLSDKIVPARDLECVISPNPAAEKDHHALCDSHRNPVWRISR
ncbi:MAG: hypothetical protein AMJ92_09245 [candidate division Zixibacteria bacterium SM23_81]|nr:MAG: hypothetical protein AMJ92_09245 [candidate division Zixibacteria bacterium SM23_81]